VDCKFCAFYTHEKKEDAYILTFDEIDQKIDELLAIGGTQILFQGGVHPKLEIEWYEDLVEHISKKYPQVTIHGFSSIEIDYIANRSKISISEVFIPGAGAEILSDRVRDIIAPKKHDKDQWLEVHRQAHKLGIKSTATRQLQDETEGFRAFIMWSYQSDHTQLKRELPTITKTSSNLYLRYLAVARLFLDNVPNIQSSWVTQGSYIGQMALLFGANDLGSTMMEENVVAAAGAKNEMNQEEMIKLISDVGEKPAKRNTAYEILERYY
jgi:cyclic dehypoxanthinyl futalosine synthase